ncbi:hypothetical protein LMG31506_04255 [Cupriavidus yeoncheonensis]|uniref:Uncharacterized protein n=1 Tax=Cupriavidus yeoncheonensis TaxID=1462994 RepID=A0A916IX35_9BURK|nr:hypothetical protein [Cupriavidus yeoncheonensis]CAG2150651.1 hypothetical protein LMG31506_04255 [Cupriavidus yeoncheonensis]
MDATATPTHRIIAARCLAALAFALAASCASAEDYSQTNVQFAYAPTDPNDFIMGTGTGYGSRATLRFEHFGTYALGDNYVLFDAYRGNDLGQGTSNRQNYFLWNSHLSLSKVTGTSLSYGPIQDVLAMVRVEDGSYSHYRAVSAGLSVYWDLPFTKGSMLETSVLARKKWYAVGTEDVQGTRALIRLFFLVPFRVAGMNATFSGPVYFSPLIGGGWDIYLEPEVFVNFGPKDAFAVGLRLEHHTVTGNNVLNTGGDKSRTTPNLVFRWTW